MTFALAEGAEDTVGIEKAVSICSWRTREAAGRKWRMGGQVWVNEDTSG